MKHAKKFPAIFPTIILLLLFISCNTNIAENNDNVEKDNAAYGMIDPADAHWDGEYHGKGFSEAVEYSLSIINYNGASFRFILTDEFKNTEEGTAALDPDNPLFAEYMQYSFNFNISDGTIVVSGGDYGAFDATYIRAESNINKTGGN